MLDGTDVSHAGLYLGGNVAEALIDKGLISQSLGESVRGCNWVQVRRMKIVPGTMEPVLKVAGHYLEEKNRYAYEEILLLAVICLTRKLDLKNAILRQLVRATMQKAAKLLEKLHKEGKEPMICSEFVFRTYDEALPEPDDPYSLEILSQKTARPDRHFSLLRRRAVGATGATPAEIPNVHPESLAAKLQAYGETPATMAATATKTAALAETEEDVESLIEEYLAEVEGVKSAAAPPAAAPDVDVLLDTARSLTARLVEAADDKVEAATHLLGARPVAEAKPRTLSDVLADFVTPGDLLKSPSLRMIHTIEP